MSATVTCTLARGLNNSGLPDRLLSSSAARFVWTNLNFSSGTPIGDDPITLLLEMLLSTGTQANFGGSGTNYDVFEAGVGLGIPVDQIDLSSFQAVQSKPDYDASNLQLGFAFMSPFPAKEFIEEELCRPFGIYLSTGRDGKVRCIQPRHPQKFYIGPMNRELATSLVPSLASPMLVPVGVYTGHELAAAVSQQLSAGLGTGPNFCQYDPVAHKFSLQSGMSNGNAYSLLSQAPFGGGVGGASVYVPQLPRPIWGTMGWTSLPVSGGAGALVAPTAVGQLPSSVASNTLTQDDIWGVEVLDNRSDQITSVLYEHDYDFQTGRYHQRLPFFDQKTFGLNGTLGAGDYQIRSRGLGLSNSRTGTTTDAWFTHHAAPSSGCDPVSYRSKTGLNGASLPNLIGWEDANSFIALVAYSLIDRYRQAPLKFRARLKWKWNSLQVGDVVRVSYSIPGIVADLELGTTTLANRLFEITELHVNFDGSIDATFLGHRYVSY